MKKKQFQNILPTMMFLIMAGFQSLAQQYPNPYREVDNWAKLPNDLLNRISNRIINEVRGINRVVYDISSKPPSTIEWE